MRTLSQNRRQRESALTLVEMMVATTLLVVMMLGLTAMFNQTQRAFRSGLKQVDVFENGRAVADLVARDFESLSDTGARNVYNFYRADFFIHGQRDLVQDNGDVLRTNTFQYVFGQSQVGNQWIGTGYCFKTNALDGVVELYRFTKQTNVPNNQLFSDYLKAVRDMVRGVSETNVHRVADGVINFTVRAFNPEGIEIAPRTNFLTFPYTNRVDFPGDETQTQILRIPTSIEVELGIIEPQTLAQAKSVANAREYLQRQAGKVHVFRQKVPIRNALK